MSRWSAGKSHRGENSSETSELAVNITQAARVGEPRMRLQDAATAATATGPAAPDTARALFPQPGLPFPDCAARPRTCTGVIWWKLSSRSARSTPGLSGTGSELQLPSVTASILAAGVTAPPLPRTGAPAPALGGNTTAAPPVPPHISSAAPRPRGGKQNFGFNQKFPFLWRAAYRSEYFCGSYSSAVPARYPKSKK